jgi:hypothetical protein
MLTHRKLYLHALNVIAGLAGRAGHLGGTVHHPALYANGWDARPSLRWAAPTMVRKFDPAILALIEECSGILGGAPWPSP